MTVPRNKFGERPAALKDTAESNDLLALTHNSQSAKEAVRAWLKS